MPLEMRLRLQPEKGRSAAGGHLPCMQKVPNSVSRQGWESSAAAWLPISVGDTGLDGLTLYMAASYVPACRMLIMLNRLGHLPPKPCDLFLIIFAVCWP